ncbi:cytochrome c [Jannaschia sp. W003]|uniref:c-type cytochrome n=1 Tax=Jannaschia sp. W003 TaxID=2867012 RepID=UPI0021A8246D|nr:cytochrome c [Jannaschia sp. W003]UWQ22086.1 cytochrome c [Jannaschia sp. W003]
MRPALIAVAALGAAAAALALAVLPGAAEPVRLRPDDPAEVALGARIYAESCAACHGARLEGQPRWREPGPDGLRPAPPHDATGHTWHHDGATLFALTRDGLEALLGDAAPETGMPAFAGLLTDAEIRAALSYIKSTWPPEIRARHDAIDAAAAEAADRETRP